MTEQQEAPPLNPRRNNRGVPGNRGGGRKPKPKTLVIDGILQDGHYQLVSVTPETIVLKSIHADRAG